MKKGTELAITSIIAMDSTISPEMARLAMDALRGKKTDAIAIPTIDDLVLKRKDVSKILGISLPMVDVYCRRGDLERVNIGKSHRSIGIKASSVRRILEGA